MPIPLIGILAAASAIERAPRTGKSIWSNPTPNPVRGQAMQTSSPAAGMTQQPQRQAQPQAQQQQPGAQQPAQPARTAQSQQQQGQQPGLAARYAAHLAAGRGESAQGNSNAREQQQEHAKGAERGMEMGR